MDSLRSYAKFFSGASMIYALSNQVRNAATEAKTLDDSLVNLQKVTDEIGGRDALYKYFDKSLSKAQELNVKVGSLIDAVTEFKKLGWDLEDAELGAKWANILSNVGDVDIDTAIGSIKTSIASFDEIGGYGNDQMDKKLEAYTDLINNMSNKYSIDADGLAESIKFDDIEFMCKDFLADTNINSDISDEETKKNTYIHMFTGMEYDRSKVEKTWNSMEKLMKQFNIPFEKAMGCMIYALKYDCGIEIPLKNICGIDVGLIQKSIPVYQKEMVKCLGMALAGGLVYLLADSLSKDW